MVLSVGVLPRRSPVSAVAEFGWGPAVLLSPLSAVASPTLWLPSSWKAHSSRSELQPRMRPIADVGSMVGFVSHPVCLCVCVWAAGLQLRVIQSGWQREKQQLQYASQVSLAVEHGALVHEQRQAAEMDELHSEERKVMMECMVRLMTDKIQLQQQMQHMQLQHMLQMRGVHNAQTPVAAAAPSPTPADTAASVAAAASATAAATASASAELISLRAQAQLSAQTIQLLTSALSKIQIEKEELANECVSLKRRLDIEERKQREGEAAAATANATAAAVTAAAHVLQYSSPAYAAIRMTLPAAASSSSSSVSPPTPWTASPSSVLPRNIDTDPPRGAAAPFLVSPPMLQPTTSSTPSATSAAAPSSPAQSPTRKPVVRIENRDTTPTPQQQPSPQQLAPQQQQQAQPEPEIAPIAIAAVLPNASLVVPSSSSSLSVAVTDSSAAASPAVTPFGGESFDLPSFHPSVSRPQSPADASLPAPPEITPTSQLLSTAAAAASDSS